MSLFTIADLHLSTNDKTNKSMEIFGARWSGYVSKLERNWRAVIGEKDTVVIPGDISWALCPEEAEADLRFLDALPGKKILGKGNHDFWWSTMRKQNALCERLGLHTLSFLFNNAYEADGYILTGSRGWFNDPAAVKAPNPSDFAKVTAREVGRLRLGLEAAERLRGDTDREILVFLHFPPVWNGDAAQDILSLLHAYGIRRVFFGHIHGNYTLPSVFLHEGIEMRLIAADHLNFLPFPIGKAKEIASPT